MAGGSRDFGAQCKIAAAAMCSGRGAGRVDANNSAKPATTKAAETELETVFVARVCFLAQRVDGGDSMRRSDVFIRGSRSARRGALSE